MQDIIKVNDAIIVNYQCRSFCKIPYHGHKNGCTNFGKHDECPPKIGLVENIFDFNKDLFFIVEEFDLESHINRMKVKHPDWTDIQLRNLLYWQNGVRKRLKEKTEKFIKENNSEMFYTLLPEAMGVMVIDTAKKLGIPIERNPIKKIFKISLVGFRKIQNDDSQKRSLFYMGD